MTSVFNQIISGKLKAYKIYEDDLIIVILAKEQIQPGHCLIIPKIEIGHFSLLPSDYFYEIHSFSQKLSKAIEAVTQCIKVGGLYAGWDINHVHYHLIPMHEYNDLNPEKAKIISHNIMLDLQRKITDKLNKILSDQNFMLEDIKEIDSLKKHLSKKENKLKKQLRVKLL